MAAGRIRWQSIPNGQLFWREWDGEHVVFNAGSGSTHVLDALSALLVKEVLADSSETYELVERVANRLALDTNRELRTGLLATLHALDDLGLIEAAPIESF